MERNFNRSSSRWRAVRRNLQRRDRTPFRRGSGIPLIPLHGIMTDAAVWVEVVGALPGRAQSSH